MAVWLPRFKLDCQTCTPGQQKSRGCIEKPEQPFSLEIDGKREMLSKCPLKLVTTDSARIMKYYKLFKNGFLPSFGGIDQQSDILMEAFDIIDNELEKMRDKENAGSHKR